ncbi:MAG TPA: PDZ domain-containing protein [Longimicrobiaceae bacterium]|nr:PDZ domain-containing protein [Longimicrobiaceae bacterium]
MSLRPQLLALTGVLALQSCLAAAQSTAPPGGQPEARTATNPGSARRGVDWGFSIGMTPGPANAYGYPYVVSVTKGSNAERAGLVVGDTILSVDGRDARQPPLFPSLVAGTRYVLRIRRGQEERELIYTFPRTETGRAPPEE